MRMIAFFVALFAAVGATPALAQTCSSQGGHCSNFCATGETSAGYLDCALPETCCVTAPPTPTTPAPAPTPTANQGTVSQPSGSGVVSLVLPSCTQSGNCTLDDIVTTGASFANLLTQLSAALFFATFVYGGALYLLSFGDKSRVDKGKKAITGAAIGMAIVLGAWTLVNYIANSLLGKI